MDFNVLMILLATMLPGMYDHCSISHSDFPISSNAVHNAAKKLPQVVISRSCSNYVSESYSLYENGKLVRKEHSSYPLTTNCSPNESKPLEDKLSLPHTDFDRSHLDNTKDQKSFVAQQYRATSTTQYRMYSSDEYFGNFRVQNHIVDKFGDED